MARMGHDNERAALLYQPRSNSADRAIADRLNALVEAEQGDSDEDGSAGRLVPVASWHGPALLAWESDRTGPPWPLTCSASTP